MGFLYIECIFDLINYTKSLPSSCIFKVRNHTKSLSFSNTNYLVSYWTDLNTHAYPGHQAVSWPDIPQYKKLFGMFSLTAPLGLVAPGQSGLLGLCLGMTSSVGFSTCPFHGRFIRCGDTSTHSSLSGLYRRCWCSVKWKCHQTITLKCIIYRYALKCVCVCACVCVCLHTSLKIYKHVLWLYLYFDLGGGDWQTLQGRGLMVISQFKA